VGFVVRRPEARRRAEGAALADGDVAGSPAFVALMLFAIYSLFAR
jgi:hypothetical protein